MKYRTFAATLLATLAAGFAGSAGAASWPERPITLIVPFPAGAAPTPSPVRWPSN